MRRTTLDSLQVVGGQLTDGIDPSNRIAMVVEDLSKRGPLPEDSTMTFDIRSVGDLAVSCMFLEAQPGGVPFLWLMSSPVIFNGRNMVVGQDQLECKNAAILERFCPYCWREIADRDGVVSSDLKHKIKVPREGPDKFKCPQCKRSCDYISWAIKPSCEYLGGWDSAREIHVVQGSRLEGVSDSLKEALFRGQGESFRLPHVAYATLKAPKVEMTMLNFGKMVRDIVYSLRMENDVCFASARSPVEGKVEKIMNKRGDNTGHAIVIEGKAILFGKDWEFLKKKGDVVDKGELLALPELVMLGDPFPPAEVNSLEQAVEWFRSLKPDMRSRLMRACSDSSIVDAAEDLGQDVIDRRVGRKMGKKLYPASWIRSGWVLDYLTDCTDIPIDRAFPVDVGLLGRMGRVSFIRADALVGRIGDLVYNLLEHEKREGQLGQREQTFERSGGRRISRTGSREGYRSFRKNGKKGRKVAAAVKAEQTDDQKPKKESRSARRRRKRREAAEDRGNTAGANTTASGVEMVEQPRQTPHRDVDEATRSEVAIVDKEESQTTCQTSETSASGKSKPTESSSESSEVTENAAPSAAEKPS